MSYLRVVLVVLACAAPAAADPPIEARRLAGEARELHRRGDYAHAIPVFEQAYAIAPSPGLLFNLAQAYRLDHRCEDAAHMYRRFLATHPEDATRHLAERHLATVERCPYTLAAPIETSVGVDLPPAPATDEPIALARAAHPHRIDKAVGIGLVVTGGIALSAATYFALGARTAANKVERETASGVTWDTLEATHERGQRDALLAKVLGIGGVVAAATGVTLYVLARRDQHAHLMITPSTTSMEVSYAWQF